MCACTCCNDSEISGVHSLLPRDLQANCSRCAALCCHAYEFRLELGDPFDKPANARCSLLNAARQCAIYATREANALHACINYECYGAGQWITREFPNGQPQDVLERFRLVRSIHEVLAMITLVLNSKPSSSSRARLSELRRELEALRGEPLERVRTALPTKRAVAMCTLRAAMMC